MKRKIFTFLTISSFAFPLAVTISCQFNEAEETNDKENKHIMTKRNENSQSTTNNNEVENDASTESSNINENSDDKSKTELENKEENKPKNSLNSTKTDQNQTQHSSDSTKTKQEQQKTNPDSQTSVQTTQPSDNVMIESDSKLNDKEIVQPVPKEENKPKNSLNSIKTEQNQTGQSSDSVDSSVGNTQKTESNSDAHQTAKPSDNVMNDSNSKPNIQKESSSPNYPEKNGSQKNDTLQSNNSSNDSNSKLNTSPTDKKIDNQINEQKNQESTQEIKQPAYKFDVPENYLNLIEQQDKADTNFYFSTWGIQTYFNMIRLSMLSKKNVQFFFNNHYEFQAKINKNALKDFLENKRIKNEEAKSEVIELMGKNDELTYYNKVKEYSSQNLDKKINVWINSDHIVGNLDILEQIHNLPNVTIVAIEDSDLLGSYFYDNYWNTKSFKDTWFDKQNDVWKTPTKDQLKRENQYLLYKKLPKLKFYWSDHYLLNKLQTLGFKNNNPFFLEEHKTLKDIVFSTKDKEEKRYTTHWAQIIGFNWTDLRSEIKKLKSENNLPTLIILGTNKANEDYANIKKVIQMYGNSYHIFYKGHPGSNYIANYIRKNFKTIHVLDSQIPSEEITSNHVNDQDPLFFDKWIGFDGISSALRGIENGKNHINDLLAIYDFDKKKFIVQQTQKDDFNDSIKLLIEFLNNKKKTN